MVTGFLAPNISENVRIAGGISFLFKESGGDWVDLGSLADVSADPQTDFLEYSSTRRGTSALIKRILTSRGFGFTFSLEEVNPDNLRYVFFGGTPTVPSSIPNIQDAEVVTGDASDPTIYTLSRASSLIAVQEVRSLDGETLYIPGSHYNASAGVITAVGAGPLDFDGVSGNKIWVQFYEQMASTTTDLEVFEILEDTVVTGQAQFAVRNPGGGLAYTIEIDSCELAPNGDISLPADGIQTLPIQVTVRESAAGEFGRLILE